MFEPSHNLFSPYVTADQFNKKELNVNEISNKPMPSLDDVVARLSKPKIGPKNGKHVILDLDETFVQTFEINYQLDQKKLTPAQKSRLYTLRFPDGSTYEGYIRPYAEILIKVLFEEFESVSVWSAGTKSYVEMIVGILFKDQVSRLKFVMSREDCNELRIGKEAAACRYKPLDIVFHKYPEQNYINTLIIDDREDVCELNCLNQIALPAFVIDDGQFEIYANDITLLRLASWIRSKEFREIKDVRLLKGRSPFKLVA